MSAVTTGALSVLFLVSPNSTTSRAVHTQGSVRIEEAAGITVLNDAPLQLLLSSNLGITAAVSSLDSGPASVDTGSLASGESGLFASITSPGEVLSVSVGGEVAVETNGRKKLKRIIAQFN